MQPKKKKYTSSPSSPLLPQIVVERNPQDRLNTAMEQAETIHDPEYLAAQQLAQQAEGEEVILLLALLLLLLLLALLLAILLHLLLVYPGHGGGPPTCPPQGPRAVCPQAWGDVSAPASGAPQVYVELPQEGNTGGVTGSYMEIQLSSLIIHLVCDSDLKDISVN